MSGQGSTFLLQEDERLVELHERAYDSEALLQALLARYPHLLAGDQMHSVVRRWLLVAREMPVPGDEDGDPRWAIDHLFLDQDAIPTLVEVKRSADTRIRREVIGQLLDYAANAVLYWPVETLRARFEATCRQEQREPDDVLSQTLDPGLGSAAFWERVGTNLQAGKVRLVVVADVIPPELRRIIEFLNGQGPF